MPRIRLAPLLVYINPPFPPTCPSFFSSLSFKRTGEIINIYIYTCVQDFILFGPPLLHSLATLENWNSRESPSPKQRDASSCGVFTCVNALLHCPGHEPSACYDASNTADLRAYMGAVWLRGGFRNELSLRTNSTLTPSFTPSSQDLWMEAATLHSVACAAAGDPQYAQRAKSCTSSVALDCRRKYGCQANITILFRISSRRRTRNPMTRTSNVFGGNSRRGSQETTFDRQTSTPADRTGEGPRLHTT